MTTITIKLPDEGAVRLLEESIKAGVSPDRFVAMLIEERLKTSAPMPPEASAAEPKMKVVPKAAKMKGAIPMLPGLNAQGLKALEGMFKNFPGAGGDEDELAESYAQLQSLKPKKRPSAKKRSGKR